MDGEINHFWWCEAVPWYHRGPYTRHSKEPFHGLWILHDVPIVLQILWHVRDPLREGSLVAGEREGVKKN
jgi:hypothetical protein